MFLHCSRWWWNLEHQQEETALRDKLTLMWHSQSETRTSVHRMRSRSCAKTPISEDKWNKWNKWKTYHLCVWVFKLFWALHVINKGSILKHTNKRDRSSLKPLPWGDWTSGIDISMCMQESLLLTVKCWNHYALVFSHSIDSAYGIKEM